MDAALITPQRLKYNYIQIFKLSDPWPLSVFCLLSSEVAGPERRQQFTQILLQETPRAALHQRWVPTWHRAATRCHASNSNRFIFRVTCFNMFPLYRQVQRLYWCNRLDSASDRLKTMKKLVRAYLYSWMEVEQDHLLIWLTLPVSLSQIRDLPDYYFHTLKFLVGHLKTVADSADKNKVRVC